MYPISKKIIFRAVTITTQDKYTKKEYYKEMIAAESYQKGEKCSTEIERH